MFGVRYLVIYTVGVGREKVEFYNHDNKDHIRPTSGDLENGGLGKEPEAVGARHAPLPWTS